jgi:hypothetical protein
MVKTVGVWQTNQQLACLTSLYAPHKYNFNRDFNGSLTFHFKFAREEFCTYES